MMKEDVLLFEVNLKERIWGGSYLSELYHQKTTKSIGEAWILSGHLNGDSIISNGKYKNKFLSEVYLNNKSLFGKSNYDRFPLLIKVLDAKDDLSVQVHPSDDYALKHHNDFGKNECWYILDAEKGAEIIYGQKAKNALEFKKYIKAGKWGEVLDSVLVKKGDFYNIPTGTVHAIGKGIKILEIQQSSDTTYRLYDYDRVDDLGNKRDLHLEDALKVINYNLEPQPKLVEVGPITRLVSNKYFTVDKLSLKKSLTIKQNGEYTMLVSSEEELEINVDNEKYLVKPFQAALITANVKRFQINSKSKVFLIRENEFNINGTYMY